MFWQLTCRSCCTQRGSEIDEKRQGDLEKNPGPLCTGQIAMPMMHIFRGMAEKMWNCTTYIYIHLRMSNRRQYTFHCLCVHPSYQNSKTAACRFFNGHHLGINLLPHTMSFVMTAVDLVFHSSPIEAVLWQWMCQLVHIVFDGDPINANRFHLGKPLSRSSQCVGCWNLYIGQLASFHMPQCDP